MRSKRSLDLPDRVLVRRGVKAVRRQRESGATASGEDYNDSNDERDPDHTDFHPFVIWQQGPDRHRAQGSLRTLAQPSFLWSERTILTDVRRLAGLAAVGVLAMATACGSSHHARLSMSNHRVCSHAYSGRLYSVRQVRGAFAALGLQLHRGDSRAPD